MKGEEKQPVTKGYLYILVEKMTVPSLEAPVSCHISLGQIAKCHTNPAPSGSNINEVFLIEVPEDPSRLIFELKDKDTVIGDCRYDVVPFFNHPGSAHTISSDIFNNSNENKGSINTKITYYSAEYGRFKIRVFHLALSQAFIDKYKVGRLKVKSSIYAQTSPEWKMNEPFDHDFDLLILLRNGNLQFDVISEAGTLATYTIYDLQKSGLLIEQTKAYQVSLFNHEKPVGSIKYQITWVH